MIAHALVVTDERTSGGWIGWMPAKMIPATSAAKPLQRMRLDAVTFILLSFLRTTALWPFAFTCSSSSSRSVKRRRVVGGVAGPGLEGGQVAVLRLHEAVSWPRND